MEILALV